MGFSGGGQGGGGTSFVPVGAILIFGGATASPPSGFVACNGQAISRATFSNLFGVIGTEYGVGDGSTTFNVPDFRTNESFPRGAVNDAARGTEGGLSTVTLTEAEMPAHIHSASSNRTATAAGTLAGAAGSAAVNVGQTITIDSTGGDAAHENKPPFVDCNYIIKV